MGSWTAPGPGGREKRSGLERRKLGGTHEAFWSRLGARVKFVKIYKDVRQPGLKWDRGVRQEMLGELAGPPQGLGAGIGALGANKLK